MIDQAHLPLGIVEYDRLVMSTLLSRNGIMISLPDVGRFRLTFEQFIDCLGFDQ